MSVSHSATSEAVADYTPVTASFNLLQPYQGRNDDQTHYTRIEESPERQTMYRMRRSSTKTKTGQRVISKGLRILLVVFLYFSAPSIGFAGVAMNSAEFVQPHLERQIANTVLTTTKLVKDGADKDDLRGAFARLANLKAKRHPVDIYNLECQMNLETFR